MYSTSRHIAGVKVLQEEFDNEANFAASHVLYNEVRGQRKARAKAAKPEEKEEVIRPIPQQPEQKKGSATKYLLMMILGVSAVLLAIVGIAFYYTSLGK